MKSSNSPTFNPIPYVNPNVNSRFGSNISNSTNNSNFSAQTIFSQIQEIQKLQNKTTALLSKYQFDFLIQNIIYFGTQSTVNQISVSIVDLSLQILGLNLQRVIDIKAKLATWFKRDLNQISNFILETFNSNTFSSIRATKFYYLGLFSLLPLSPPTRKQIEKLFFDQLHFNTDQFLIGNKTIGLSLTGLTYWICSLELENLVVACHLFFQIWRKHNNEELIEHGCVVFRAFQKVFFIKLKYSRDLEWLNSITNETIVTLHQFSQFGSSIISIFALGGLLKGKESIRQKTLEFYGEQIFSQLVQAVEKIYDERYFLPPQRELWQQAVAIVCANLYNFHNNLSKRCMIDVFLGNILDIKWIFEDLRCGKQQTFQNIQKKLSSRVFRFESGRFVDALSNQFFESISNEDRSLANYLLDSMIRFSKNLYEEWRRYQLTIFTQKIPDELTIHITPLLQTIFLSFTFIFEKISPLFGDEEIIKALDIYAYLNFSRLDNPTYQENLKTLLGKIRLTTSDPIQSKNEAVIETHFISLIPVYIFEPEFSQTLVIEDTVEMSRVYFLLSVLEKIIHLFSNLVIENQLPLLFSGLEHFHEPIRKYCHNIFEDLFLHKANNFTHIMPYYTKISLENYPSLTPIDCFQTTFDAMAKSIDIEFCGVILFCIGMVETAVLNSIKSNTPKMKLIQLFTKQITTVPLQILQIVLHKVQTLLHSSPRHIQEPICDFVFQLILNNFDYSRKNQLIHWYLQQLEQLNLIQQEQLARAAL